MNGTAHCGAFLERFQQEHQEFNHALNAIRHEFERLDAGDDPQEVLRNISLRLQILANDLRQHFTDEEECGCVADVFARCPSLESQVKPLLTEHPRLLQTIESLAISSREKSTPQRLRQDFEEFARQLKSHEATQSRLLQMALGGEASDFDVEGNE